MSVRTALVAIAAAALGAALTWGFLAGRGGGGEGEEGEEGEAPIVAPLRAQGGRVTLTEEEQDRAGIETAPLAASTSRPRIAAVAEVLDPTDLSDLRARRAEAAARLQSAEAKLEASRPRFERLQALHGMGGAASDRDFQEAEAAYRADEAEASAAREALDTIERSARLQWGGALAQAAIEGSELYVEAIERRRAILRVTLPADRAGEAAEIRVDGVEAEIVSPAPRTDPRVQGTAYYVAVEDERLLPGMTRTAFAAVGDEREGVVVPSSAVVWWQGRAWAYVRREAEEFEREGIATDSPGEGGWFVAEGLDAGDEVVVRGAEILLSEELRAQIPVGNESD